MATWLLTKDPAKTGGVVSSLPNCGYDDDTLRGILNRGYKLYCDGKPVKVLGPKKRKKVERGERQ
jgi:hypothetical protein